MNLGTGAFKLENVEVAQEINASPDNQEEDFGNGTEVLISAHLILNINTYRANFILFRTNII